MSDIGLGQLIFVKSIILLCALLPFIAMFVNCKMKTKMAKIKLLRTKWELAREGRLLWKEQHWSGFNFHDPEYQRLWEIEIGAEALYLMHGPTYWHAMSWDGYKAERQDFEHDKC